jgi:hypothetical protein
MMCRNNGRGKCQEVKDRGEKWMIKVRRDHNDRGERWMIFGYSRRGKCVRGGHRSGVRNG